MAEKRTRKAHAAVTTTVTDGEPVTVKAETPETGEVFATGMTVEHEYGFPNPCVYCGPSVRGVARQYTTYQGGIPDALKAFLQEHPEAAGLIVPTGKFAAVRRRLDNPGTEEAKLYRRVKEAL